MGTNRHTPQPKDGENARSTNDHLPSPDSFSLMQLNSDLFIDSNAIIQYLLRQFSKIRSHNSPSQNIFALYSLALRESSRVQRYNFEETLFVNCV